MKDLVGYADGCLTRWQGNFDNFLTLQFGNRGCRHFAAPTALSRRVELIIVVSVLLL